MASVPKTMKAWIITKAGEPNDVLELKANWPTPAPPKGGDIMVKVSHAALNPLDLVMMRTRIPFKKNAVPAVDFCGEVVQAGPSVPSEIRVGMTVCGTFPTMHIMRGFGTLAEYMVIPAHAVAEKPLDLEPGVAAGLLGVPGQTTAILLRAASLKEGDRVLVNGASGGVGCVLLPMLREAGVRATAVCSAKNDTLVRKLGAVDVVDYTAHESLYAYLSTTFKETPFDAVLDLVGNEKLYKESPGYLKPSGTVFNIAGGMTPLLKYKIQPVLLGGTPRAYSHVMNSPAGTGAKEVAGWVDKGLIKDIPIDSRFDMEDAVKAFEKLASKRATGKIIVKVN